MEDGPDFLDAPEHRDFLHRVRPPVPPSPLVVRVLDQALEGVTAPGLRDIGGRTGIHVRQFDALEVARDHLRGVEDENHLSVVRIHVCGIPPVSTAASRFSLSQPL